MRPNGLEWAFRLLRRYRMIFPCLEIWIFPTGRRSSIEPVETIVAFAKCAGARKPSVLKLALTNVTNAPILLGTKTMRQAPAGEKASTRSIYAPPKVLGTNPSQTQVVSFSSSGLFQFTPPPHQSMTALHALRMEYAPVILFDRTSKINDACTCSATRWILSDPIRPQ